MQERGPGPEIADDEYGRIDLLFPVSGEENLIQVIPKAQVNLPKGIQGKDNPKEYQAFGG
jgi:hypothetical protein